MSLLARWPQRGSSIPYRSHPDGVCVGALEVAEDHDASERGYRVIRPKKKRTQRSDRVDA